MTINKDNATIRHYQGLIRDLQAQLKNALARITRLEARLKKIPLSSGSSPSNMSLFASDDINRGGAFATSSGGAQGAGGGLTSTQIKNLVSQWLSNGELPISVHDHTTDQKGGDAFASKGAKLQ